MQVNVLMFEVKANNQEDQEKQLTFLGPVMDWCKLGNCHLILWIPIQIWKKIFGGNYDHCVPQAKGEENFSGCYQ